VANGGQGEGDITVKMILSGEELERVLTGRGPREVGGQIVAGGVPKVAIEKASPSFMSIFKPLVALEAVKVGIKSLVQHSSIANTYLGAMGKMFGAAVDLLLLPFMPIFNMLMLAMGQLIKWLYTSGVLDAISKGVDNVMKFLGALGGDLANIWNAIRSFDLRGIVEGLGSSLKTTIKAFVKHPIEMGVTAIIVALAARAAWRTVMGGPMAGGGMGAGFMGAGAAARGLGGGSAVVGLGRAGMGLGGAAMMGYGGMEMARGGGVFGTGGGVGGGIANVAAMTAGGAMVGATLGSVVPVLGTGIGAGVGAGLGAATAGILKLGGKMGWWGGGGKGQDRATQLLEEQNQILRGMATGAVYQDVTIYGTQPELIAEEVLSQSKSQGLSVAGG